MAKHRSGSSVGDSGLFGGAVRKEIAPILREMAAEGWDIRFTRKNHVVVRKGEQSYTFGGTCSSSGIGLIQRKLRSMLDRDRRNNDNNKENTP